MRSFKGPRYQGGWIGIAISAASAAYKAKQKKKERQEEKEDLKELSAESFSRQAWLAQQQRKFQLEDRQYIEDATAGYQQFYTGQPVQAPPRTSTAGLADWEATEGKNLVPLLSSGYRYGS